MDIIQENILLNIVFERLVFGLTKKYQWQVKHPDNPDCSYLPPFCPIHQNHKRCEHLVPLDQEHLRQHFSQTLWKNYSAQTLTYSGLSIAGLFPGGRVRWLMIDMDTPLACHTIRSCLLPVLDKYGIDYLWEHSGRPDYEKAHCLILMDCTILLQRTFVPMLLSAAGLENWQQWNLEYPEDFKLEMFPFQLEENMIRLPGSIHQRTGRVNYCTYKTVTSNTKENIMLMIASMKILDSSRITELVMLLSPEHERKLKIHEQVKSVFKHAPRLTSPKDFKYIPQGLTLPAIPVPYPRSVKKMFSNCPAMNHLWLKSVRDNALRRGNIHKWGLLLANFALFDDLQNQNRQLSAAYSIGERFIDYVYNDLRGYSFESHHWREYKQKFTNEPLGLIPSCSKMSSLFGMCKDCIYASQPDFCSPSQFVTGTAIIRTVTRQVRMVTNEYIRSYEFPQIKSWIKTNIFQKKLIGNKTQEDIVLAHHQGSGKSVCADEIMSELSYYGATSLLAVHDSKLALQHKSNFDYFGQESMFEIRFPEKDITVFLRKSTG